MIIMYIFINNIIFNGRITFTEDVISFKIINYPSHSSDLTSCVKQSLKGKMYTLNKMVGDLGTCILPEKNYIQFLSKYVTKTR